MLVVFRTLVACDLNKLTLVNLANEFSVARKVQDLNPQGYTDVSFFSPARSAKNLKTVFFNFDLHYLLVCSGVKFLARN